MAYNAAVTDLFSPILFVNIVITGFNTDIVYQGTTYHVQTEDKGVKTPLILSLVYDRGTILASKRSAYDDLLIGTFNEIELSERLQKQHKLICAAVRAGRIEDLKRMTTRESASKRKSPFVQDEIKLPIATKSPVTENYSKNNIGEDASALSAQLPYQEKSKPLARPEVEKTSVDSAKSSAVEAEDFVSNLQDELIWDVPVSIVEEPIIEAVQVVEELILSAEAVEILTDYIDDSDVDTRLKVKLLTNEKLKSGERKTLSIAVKRGNQIKGLSGAQVIVKILGSSFRPLIFHSQTDDNGIATVHLQLPQFKSGRAALLIKAINEGEEVELRRVVQQS